MSLRRSLVALGLAATVLTPMPALARDRDSRALSEAADTLNDPRTQIAVAAALASLSEALLDLRVGGFAKAIEDAGMGDRDTRRIPEDATLGDLAGRDARDMPRKLASEAPRMMGAMAGMAGALEGMLPQLREMGERMKDAIPRR